MTVADVLEDAKYGELAQLGIVKNLTNADPATVETAERKIVSYINLGLIELFKRFDLRTEETSLIMDVNITVYTLTPPLLNNILAVYDEAGVSIPLNLEEDPNSINTPSYNTLQIPNPSDGGGIFVLYNSAPERLQWNADLSTIPVPIPPSMLEALLHYVGYRGHGATDGNVDAENNTHYMRFEKSCQTLTTLGLIATQAIETGLTLEEKGFK